MLTNRATRLEVSQGHQIWYHSLCEVGFPISVLYQLQKCRDLENRVKGL